MSGPKQSQVFLIVTAVATATPILVLATGGPERRLLSPLGLLAAGAVALLAAGAAVVFRDIGRDRA